MDGMGCELVNFGGGKTGFESLLRGALEEIAGIPQLGLATGGVALFGHEGAEALAAVDDPIAFQLIIGTLYGDQTDEEFLSKGSEGGQGGARRELSLADDSCKSGDDLAVEGAGCGGGDGADEEGDGFFVRQGG